LVDSTGGEYEEYTVEHFYGELKPEKINTLEFGVGYEVLILTLMQITTSVIIKIKLSM